MASTMAANKRLVLTVRGASLRSAPHPAAHPQVVSRPGERSLAG